MSFQLPSSENKERRVEGRVSFWCIRRFKIYNFNGESGPPETMGAEKDEIVNKQRAAAWLRERDEHRRGREEWRVNCEDSILQTLMRSVLLKKPKVEKKAKRKKKFLVFLKAVV